MDDLRLNCQEVGPFLKRLTKDVPRVLLADFDID